MFFPLSIVSQLDSLQQKLEFPTCFCVFSDVGQQDRIPLLHRTLIMVLYSRHSDNLSDCARRSSWRSSMFSTGSGELLSEGSVLGTWWRLKKLLICSFPGQCTTRKSKFWQAKMWSCMCGGMVLIPLFQCEQMGAQSVYTENFFASNRKN